MLALTLLLCLQSDENLPVIVIGVCFDFATDSKLILSVNIVNCVRIEVNLDLNLLDDEVVLQEDFILFLGWVSFLTILIGLPLNGSLFDVIISKYDSLIVEPCH